MAPGVNDQVLFGGPPKANEYVPGGSWLHGWTAQSAPYVLELDVYAYSPPNAIQWGVEWFDAREFTASTLPVGTTPGLWHASYDYAKPGIWHGYVEAPARTTFHVDIGKIPVWDDDKREFMWTVPEREAEERRKAAYIQQQMKVPAGGQRR
jgi:hypothetical protein